MKNHLIQLLIVLCASPVAYAGTGLLFSVQQGFGGPGATLTIRTTIPNSTYRAAGIKVNTPSYALTTPSEQCTLASTGYCLFTVSDTVPKNISLTGSGDMVSVTLCLNGNGPISCQTSQVDVSQGQG